MLAVLGGCAATPYPGDWPQIGRDRLAGHCPDLAGVFRNTGSSHPPAAKPLSLTAALGIADGDRVQIEQSPRALTVTVWRDGERIETTVFNSADGKAGWNTDLPRSYVCPVDLALLHPRLYFSHMLKPASVVGTYGALGGSGAGAYFAKGADGSLLLACETWWGALIAILPVGSVDRVWYRFPAAE